MDVQALPFRGGGDETCRRFGAARFSLGGDCRYTDQPAAIQVSSQRCLTERFIRVDSASRKQLGCSAFYLLQLAELCCVGGPQGVGITAGEVSQILLQL